MSCLWHFWIFHMLTKWTTMSCTNESFRAIASFHTSSLVGQFFRKKKSSSHQWVSRVCCSLYRIIEFGFHFSQNIICSETQKINCPLRGQLYTPTPGRGSCIHRLQEAPLLPGNLLAIPIPLQLHHTSLSQPSVSFPHWWSVSRREQWRYFKCYVKADLLTTAWWLHQKLSVRTVPKASSSNCCHWSISLKGYKLA